MMEYQHVYHQQEYDRDLQIDELDDESLLNQDGKQHCQDGVQKKHKVVTKDSTFNFSCLNKEITELFFTKSI